MASMELLESAGVCRGGLNVLISSNRKVIKNRRALKKIVDSGEVPSILAYVDSQPVDWCSVAPREHFPTLERSRILKRVDNEPVWSIVCFFVAKAFRRKGVTVELLKAAVKHVKEHGGKVCEGYPVDPKEGKSADAFVFTGLVSAFRKTGFVEVIRRSETRPIMRYVMRAR